MLKVATNKSSGQASSSSTASNNNNYYYYYAALGDAGHWISLFCTFFYAGAVATTVNGGGGSSSGSPTVVSYWDQQWQNDGFCVTAKNIQYRSSHDVCFYVDVVLTAIMGVLFLLWRKTIGLEDANKYVVPNMLGTVAHGLGHAVLAAEIRKNEVVQQLQSVTSSSAAAAAAAAAAAEILLPIEKSLVERLREDSVKTVVMEELPYVFFWLGLIYATMPTSSKRSIFVMSILALLGQNLMARNLVFTYVQTVLLFCFSLNQLNLPSREKNYPYALYPYITSIPVTLVGWIESTQCTAFVKSYLYGHVIYDGYIALSLIVWYALCFWHTKSDHEDDAMGKIKTH